MSGAVVPEHGGPGSASRWALCFVMVLAVHVAVGLLLLRRTDMPTQPAEPPAVLLELAPRPEAVAEPTPPEPEPPPPAAAVTCRLNPGCSSRRRKMSRRSCCPRLSRHHRPRNCRRRRHP